MHVLTRGSNFHSPLPNLEGEPFGVTQMLHDRLGHDDLIPPDLVERHADGEHLGVLLPLGHALHVAYHRIYDFRSIATITVDTPALSIYGDMPCPMYATVGPEYEKRLLRAKEIASRGEEIEALGDGQWSVPSQTGFGRYRVLSNGNDFACGCKDYKARQEPCKHVLAVRELFLTTPTPAIPKRRQYPQKWGAYDLGQVKEMRLVDRLLRDLVSDVPEVPRVPGAPGPAPMPLADGIYCAVLKVYSGLSGRRATGVYENVSDRGLIDRAPSYMVASRALNRPEVTPILYSLLTASAAPLAGLEDGGAVAPDSTGVQTTSFGGWREAKHGEQREKKWLKVHAICGTKTHVVIRAVVSDANSADCPQFIPLLRGALEDGFRPETVLADKGYLSKENYRLASDLGLEAFIPFKSNSRNRAGHRGSPKAWRDAFCLFQLHREEFDANYHKRSNVESVFSALKRKFGENVRSKNPVAQVNEILCKLIAYNLTVVVHEMFENGVVPEFLKLNQGE